MKLTPNGKKMAEFPLEPMYAKAVIAAHEFHCVDEVVAIVAMLSIDTVFFATTEKSSKRLAEEARKHFSHPKGDHFLLLNIYIAYSQNSTNRFEWCKENAINYKSMMKVDSIVEQLREYCASASLELKYTFENFGKKASKYDEDNICKAFTSGFFLQSVALQLDGTYATLIDHQVYIFV